MCVCVCDCDMKNITTAAVPSKSAGACMWWSSRRMGSFTCCPFLNILSSDSPGVLSIILSEFEGQIFTIFCKRRTIPVGQAAGVHQGELRGAQRAARKRLSAAGRLLGGQSFPHTAGESLTD